MLAAKRPYMPQSSVSFDDVRVLLLTQYYPPEIGGAQTRLAAFCGELLRAGHCVDVVTAMPHHLLGRVYDGYRRRFWMHERVDGVDVWRTWVYAATGKGIARAINYLSFTFSSLLGVLRVKRPDMVFVESPPLTLGISGLLAARIFRAPLIFNASDLWPDSVRDLGVLREGPLLRLLFALEVFLYQQSAVVNAVTDGIARTLQRDKGVPAEKIGFLPNGVDLELFAPRPPDDALCAELRIGNKPVLLYAGTHGIGMGLENVVEAARLLGNDAVIVFVGDGPTKSDLVRRSHAARLENVRFVDAVPLREMPRFYSIATASVVPLVRVGVTLGARPSKLFPSLASGVPVIFSGEGEGAKLVAGADAGIAVAPEDSGAIADAMRALASDERTRRRLAQNARTLALKFGWPAVVERWLDWLEDRRIIPHDHSQDADSFDVPTMHTRPVE